MTTAPGVEPLDTGAEGDPGAGAAAPAPPRVDGPPTVAAFDFDGTLARGGSEFNFLLRVRGLLPVMAAILRHSPKLIKGMVLGGPAADAGKQALFAQLLSGQPAGRLQRVGADFARDHLRRRLRPEVHDRLVWHRSQGHRVVIVSASPECYVRVAGEQLGADDTLATRLQVGGGLLTGRFDGRNCRGPEKFSRLEGWLRAEGFYDGGGGRPVVWAYGNSRGDLRLLDAADHGVDTGRLGPLGRLRRFPRLGAVVAHSGQGPGVAQSGSAAAPTTTPR
ncbi:MAG TPA: HAD-IB family hydrolase [Acidimicrobiales bacterium]|nr:HAD-IB family hydrolase [Acidimicrobiales bacterium]